MGRALPAGECPACGTPRQGRGGFCGYCGSRLRTEQRSSVEAPRTGLGRPTLVLGAVVLAAMVSVAVWALVSETASEDRGVVELTTPSERNTSAGDGGLPQPRTGLPAALPCARAVEMASLECPTWALDAAPAPFGAPVVEGPRVFVGSGSGLIALETTTGDVTWVHDLGAAVTRRAAVASSTVYVVDLDNRVTALDWSSGWRRWQTTLEQRAISDPIEVAGTVVVATIGRVVGLGATDGTVTWEAAVSGMPSQPVGGAGRVLVGDGNGEVRALDPATGEVMWHQPAGGFSVAVSDLTQLVLTSGFSGPLVGLDLDTGEQVWATDVEVGWAIPHPGPGPLVHLLLDEELWHVDAATGRATQLHATPPVTPSPPDQFSHTPLTVAVDGLLFVEQPTDPELIALDPTDASMVWRNTWSRGIGHVTTGWADHRPWIAVLDADRRRLAVLPAPRREVPSPPARLEPGEACPTTPLVRRPYATVAASGRSEITGLGVAPPERYVATLVMDVDGVDGPLTISGQRLDGTGTMGFRGNFRDDPAAEIVLRDGPRRLHEGWPPHSAVVASVPTPGCWVYHLDGPGYHDRIVVEITPDYFEELPAHDRQAPVGDS